MIARWRRFTFAATSLVMVLAVLFLEREGQFAMAEPSVQLGWQWRAGRALEQCAGLRLVRIQKEGSGLFGIGRSPSLGGSLPDAQRVEAEVLAVNQPGPVEIGARIGFRIPKVELRGAGEGALVAVGMIGNKVVCLAPAPEEVDEASVPNWLSETPCP